jgi:hypothetical protein
VEFTVLLGPPNHMLVEVVFVPENEIGIPNRVPTFLSDGQECPRITQGIALLTSQTGRPGHPLGV